MGGQGDICEETFELRPEGQSGAKHVDVWGKEVVGGGESRCKGPVVGATLVYLRNRKTIHVAGVSERWAEAISYKDL